MCVCDVIKIMVAVSHVFVKKSSRNHLTHGAGFIAIYPSFPPHSLDPFGAVSRLGADSASEAMCGDRSNGCPSYSLSASWCPIASRSRVHSHHRFVRRSPDSGGGSLTHLRTRNLKGVSSSSCARVVVRGFCCPVFSAGAHNNKTLYLATIGHKTAQHSTSLLHATFRLLLTLPFAPARVIRLLVLPPYWLMSFAPCGREHFHCPLG